MPIVPSNNGLRALVIAGNDQDLGEQVRFTSWTQGREDPDRPAREVLCQVALHNEKTTNLSGGRSEDWKTDVRAGGARFLIDLATYPDFRVQKGDEVRALERPGEPVFVVIAEDRRGAGRMIVEAGSK